MDKPRYNSRLWQKVVERFLGGESFLDIASDYHLPYPGDQVEQIIRWALGKQWVFYKDGRVELKKAKKK